VAQKRAPEAQRHAVAALDAQARDPLAERAAAEAREEYVVEGGDGERRDVTGGQEQRAAARRLVEDAREQRRERQHADDEDVINQERAAAQGEGRAQPLEVNFPLAARGVRARGDGRGGARRLGGRSLFYSHRHLNEHSAVSFRHSAQGIPPAES
jgi:hypothetical protein